MFSVSSYTKLDDGNCKKSCLLFITMISSHSSISRRPFVREERLEDEDLTEADDEDGRGHENGPNHHALV